MLWLKTKVFSIPCACCDDPFDVEVVMGRVQRTSALCPACHWLYAEFGEWRGGALYLRKMQQDMLATLSEWASVDHWSQS